MSDIYLHARLGVNPRMTTCPICRKASGIVLLGTRNYYDICCDCGVKVYGGITERGPCPQCGCKHGRDRTYLSDDERQINAPMICSECEGHMKTRIALIMAEQVKGGTRILGPMVWIKEEAWKEIASGPEVEQSLKMRAAYLSLELWDKLGLPHEAPGTPDEK